MICIYKPNSVSVLRQTIDIYLGLMLPGGSSDSLRPRSERGLAHT